MPARKPISYTIDEAKRRIVMHVEFNDAPDEALFEVSVAALVTRLAPATLQAMRSRGEGPWYRKVRSRVLYPKWALISWLNSQKPRQG